VLDSNTKVFLEQIKAGLWGTESRLSDHGEIDYSSVMKLAEEQSVVGLVTDGLERVKDVRVPQQWTLQFIGSTLQLEQRNKAMNAFIASLVEKMRAEGIYTLLVKGQGIAQCYEKPTWRACGDVDLFLSDNNYERAKAFLKPLATSVEVEYEREKHLGMTIDGWVVELHGRLYCGLSSRIEQELDDVYIDTFNGGSVRPMTVQGSRFTVHGEVVVSGTQVFMLSVENDVFYVFTHILQHFFKEGVGLRQICDWCRLMWTYREQMDAKKLERRLRKAGIMSEWKAFAALAIEYLGMPIESVPLLNADDNLNANLKKKAKRISEFILKTGNMGHNRDMSHYSKQPYLIRKCVSMGRRIGDLINHARIFPLDSLRFFPRIMWNGVRSAIRREG